MECAICYEPMTCDTLKTECGHKYHAACIGTWFQTHTTCPTCRAVVAPMAGAAPADPGPLYDGVPWKMTCRTLAPWEEVRWGCATVTGLRVWMNDVVFGGGITRDDMRHIRTWLAGAQAGDVLWLNDELEPVTADVAELELRCNV